MKIFQLIILIQIGLLSTLFVGCGVGGSGGGSGTDASSDLAANVEVAVSPGVVDTGDRTTATIYIDNISEDGVVIKLRFPIGVRYILGTSELQIDGDSIAVAPTTNVSDEKNSYLVYFFRKSLFGDSSAFLELKLLATAKVAKGLVEVDADLNDISVDDQDEFLVATPNFSAQGSDGITVND